MEIKYKNQTFMCILDSEDEEYFSQWNWYYRKGYVGRHRTKRDPPGNHWVHLHWEVLFKAGIEIPPKMCIDHINRNKMDNRKDNLRVVTRSENGKNVSDSVKLERLELVRRATIAAAKKPRTELQLNTAKDRAIKINASGKNKHIGPDNYASKMVINIQTGVIYSCIRECAQVNNLNYSTLKSRLNGGLKNNTQFRYFNHTDCHIFHPINLGKEEEN